MAYGTHMVSHHMCLKSAQKLHKPQKLLFIKSVKMDIYGWSGRAGVVTTSIFRVGDWDIDLNYTLRSLKIARCILLENIVKKNVCSWCHTEERQHGFREQSS